MTRFLRYEDLDEDSVREVYTLAESGVVLKESPQSIRQFCNRAVIADPGSGLPLPYGGYLFEFDPTQQPLSQYTFLTLDPNAPADIPKEAVYFDNGVSKDWWFPVVGDQRISGQMANTHQAGQDWQSGTSMHLALLPDPNDSNELKNHLVTGTVGGYVRAIPVPDAGVSTFKYSYNSPDFGWNVIGMDAGNLDLDPEDEIVVGSWLDNGSFDDWVSWKTTGGAADKNRGGLFILDVNTASGTWNVTRLSADDLIGTRFGIGSGVFGVKIDDVDANGVAEIWATDAAGHIYLFRNQGGGSWAGFYRSADLGAYPGVYNNLHVAKDDAGHTTRLVAVSSGYVMAFDVDWTLLSP